ncbi:D-2-hydroxyacid dehydrogenase [Alsobacter sp. SYSU M60028]|uniref:D-2-hydroxyacid dehydrogenase n=1 Tax=Alsobacter ponti TaxID=2962936 RepID=A0ABT1LHF9_9HYPH|nr:D-2-hydroxyacid dehydrogenase [Alsobacter ponti]MCP8940386.1 D-2-hydroxyacid dehydrogenase [Alsobacter ponti]
MTDGTGLRIAVGGDINEARLAELRAIAPGADIAFHADQKALDAAIPDANVVAGLVPAEALARAGRLKWVHSWAAGPDPQLYPAFVESPVVLTCSKGNGAIPLAEHAMMLMLMLNRNALHWVEAQRHRRWDRIVHGELNGLTVGIIGTGYSGADLALKCKAFHMRVLGLRRGGAPAPNVDRMYRRDELREMLAECDFVVMTAPKTPETVDMLGEAEFRAMKPTAFYICFSRGGVANDKALYRALSENWIAGAGLDAHDVEPLPPESPFWSLPNTIITPHNGATSAQTPERGYRIFVDNLARYVAGRELVNVVDKRAGY